MPDEFDWLKAMLGVDILQIEAVGEVVGRTIGKLVKGMTDAGMTEERADRVVSDAFAAVFKFDKPGGEST